MKRKKIYSMVNLLVFFLGGYIFYRTYLIDFVQFDSISMLGVTIITAFLVYFMKAVRLYIVLYGADIPMHEYMEQYCKTVPISVVFPFKLGDVFRAYCFGNQMNNYIKGIIVIALDRFVDAMALTVMIFAVNLMGNSKFPVIFYFLAGFLLFMIACYIMFPPMYQYWKKYFLRRKASERRNAFLKFLCRLNSTYQEVSEVVKGRFAVLFIISLFAWTAEIGRLAIFNSKYAKEGTMPAVADYLTSALYKTESVYLKQFIFSSVLMMSVFYLVLYCRRFLKK